MGQPACSGGDGSDSSAHKRERPGGGDGLHLGTRAISSGGVTSHSSEALSLLGVIALISGSIWEISYGALPSEAGAIGPSQPHLLFLGQADCHSELQRQGTHEVPTLLCTAPPGASQNRQCIFVEPWPKPLSLQPAPCNNPELP